MKERSKWVASQESKASCEMCGWGEWGRWGHTCGSLKYHIFIFISFTLELSWGVTNGVGLALDWGKTEGEKEKRKKKKKREMG